MHQADLVIAVEGLSANGLPAFRPLLQIGEVAGAAFAQPMVQKLVRADDGGDVFVMDEIVHLERRQIGIRRTVIESDRAFRNRPLLGMMAPQVAALRTG
ncbi:hypothetical protein [Sinorhizobium fredii]|uniref:hypothetical protein n=1 Tax=Rhizobium fredii TaxID=380 RepID=UPI001F3DB20F|nr:hypothetical protein [Sinorhizobium fredii]